MGRTPKPIDAEQVERLAGFGCTQQEIADFFRVSIDTIQRRFAAELVSARAYRKISLRRAQMVRAIKDKSDSMLIHLGKCYLGQSDKSQTSESPDDPESTDANGNAVEP